MRNKISTTKILGSHFLNDMYNTKNNYLNCKIIIIIFYILFLSVKGFGE